MVEILTVTTLRHKSDEIRRAIIAYEEKLDQAKADLAHVSAAIAIFEGPGGESTTSLRRYRSALRQR